MFFAAGLLTYDPRVHERQKPGQYGARRKYTWYASQLTFIFSDDMLCSRLVVQY